MFGYFWVWRPNKLSLEHSTSAEQDQNVKRSGAGQKLSEWERSGEWATGRARKRWSGIMEQEQSGEWTKLAAQISLKGYATETS